MKVIKIIALVVLVIACIGNASSEDEEIEKAFLVMELICQCILLVLAVLELWSNNHMHRLKFLSDALLMGCSVAGLFI